MRLKIEANPPTAIPVSELLLMSDLQNLLQIEQLRIIKIFAKFANHTKKRFNFEQIDSFNPSNWLICNVQQPMDKV